MDIGETGTESRIGEGEERIDEDRSQNAGQLCQRYLGFALSSILERF